MQHDAIRQRAMMRMTVRYSRWHVHMHMWARVFVCGLVPEDRWNATAPAAAAAARAPFASICSRRMFGHIRMQPRTLVSFTNPVDAAIRQSAVSPGCEGRSPAPAKMVFGIYIARSESERFGSGRRAGERVYRRWHTQPKCVCNFQCTDDFLLGLSVGGSCARQCDRRDVCIKATFLRARQVFESCSVVAYCDALRGCGGRLGGRMGWGEYTIYIQLCAENC